MTGRRIVRTVTGDVSPDSLGITLGHEHLIAKPGAQVTDIDLHLDGFEPALAELSAFSREGGGAVVEMTTVDYGRDPAALRRLASESGVAVVAATGFNKGKFADHISSRYDERTLAEWMVTEVEVGMIAYLPPERIELRGGERTAAHAGLIKASSSAGGPGEYERLVFGAAVLAHRATGAPIGTHTEQGSWALEQARFFVDAGVDPRKVLIGHCDFIDDIEYLSEVTAAGVNIGFDQFSKEKYRPDAERVQMIVELSERGFGDSLILSGDLARRSYWPAYGGSGQGLSHIPFTVAGMLRDAGFGDAQLSRLLIDNPLNWLAFTPQR